MFYPTVGTRDFAIISKWFGRSLKIKDNLDQLFNITSKRIKVKEVIQKLGLVL